MKTRHTKGFVLLTILAGCAIPNAALAADPQAEALYQEGRRAAQKKDWSVACTKFRESHDREPAPGTLLNLADCEENRGKLVEALTRFQAAARLFKAGDERATYANQRATALEKRIPKLTLRLSAISPTQTTVERDGAPVPATSLGTPATVDPGEHAIVVRAPGRSDVRSTVRLAEGETRELELSPGPAPAETVAVAAPAPAAVQGTPAAAPEPSAPATKRSTSTASLRPLAYASLGVGAVGIGLGAVAGLITAGAKSTADSNCTPGCNQDGLDAEKRGKTWSTVSTVSFVVGGIGLATGATLLLLPATKSNTRVGVAPLPGGGFVGYGASF